MRAASIVAFSLCVAACGAPASDAPGARPQDREIAREAAYREPAEAPRGAIAGRVTNARVPNADLARATVDVFDHYPVGGDAPIAASQDLRLDGRFALDVPAGTYWVGARVGGYYALRGPVVVDAAGGPQDLELAPDYIATDVATRRTADGAALLWAHVAAFHPQTGARIVRAVATLSDGAREWRMPFMRTPAGGLGYYVAFTPDQAPRIASERLTVTLRSPEFDDVPQVRELEVARLSEPARVIPSPNVRAPAPDDAPAPSRGVEVRWHAPADASYSVVCVMAPGEAIVVGGCDQAVTSPHWVDTTGLPVGSRFDLLVSVGRAVANGNGTTFNIDSVQVAIDAR